MITLLAKAISVVQYTIFDRLCGDDRGPGKFVEAFLMGVALFVILQKELNIFKWECLAFSLLWVLGTAPGWSFIGDILNDRKSDPDWEGEWYQNEYLVRHPWISVLVRSLIWGLPVQLLMFYTDIKTWIPLVAICIGFPASLLIAQRLSYHAWRINNTVIAEDKWSKAEFIRGLITSIVAWLLAHTCY